MKCPNCGIGSPAGYLLLVFALAAVGWYFLIPIPGLPVPAGAVVDADYHFAVFPASASWAESRSRALHGDYFEALAFRRADDPARIPASLIVLVRSEPVADYSEDTKPQLQAAALAGIAAVYPEHRHLTTRDVLVDNLKALRLTGSVRRKSSMIEVSTGPAAVFEYATDAVLVSGADRAYLLLATLPLSEAAVLQPLVDRAFSSFRVSLRPLVHHQTVKSASHFAVIAGTALLFILVFYRIVMGVDG